MKHGFSLIELLIIIVLIGILSALAYSSINELIQTNKAKEAARLMTSFVERSLTEGKMRQASVDITINNSVIKAEMGNVEISETLSNGFKRDDSNTPSKCSGATPNAAITSVPRIGISGIDGTKCFVACNGSYCGAAVKVDTKNNFIAQVKKKNSGWEDL